MPYWHLGLISQVCVVLATGLTTVRPMLLGMIVDRVIQGGEYDLLWLLCLGVIAGETVRGACNYGRMYAGHVFGANAVYELRNTLYSRLQSFSFGYYDTARTGDLMSRLAGDVEVFRQFLAFGFSHLVEFALLFFFGLITMGMMNWRLTLLALCTMPFLITLTMRFHVLVHPAFTYLREAMSDMSTAVQESITGIRTVKSFAREPHQIDTFGDRVDAFVDRHMDTARLWARFFPAMELMGHLSVLILLYVGGRDVMTGRMSVGNFVSFYSLIWLIINPLQQLGYQVNNFTQSVAAGERLLEVLQTSTDIKDSPTAKPLENMQGRVKFEHVHFSYKRGMAALEDINLTVEPGQVVGILGPTGAGKSTLVSLIPRFYDVTSGRVMIDGHDVRNITLSSLRRQVAVVFQETFLFSTTLRENIGYARRDATMREIEEAARLACAHDFIMETPQGYDTLVGERGLGLSGGQKQRIAIARAILANPRILILDDATASVDMETEFEIQQALKTLMKGRTTFIIAHRISSVKDADIIVVLDHGRIVEQGTHSELLARNGVYRRVYDVQYRDHASILQQLRQMERQAHGA